MTLSTPPMKFSPSGAGVLRVSYMIESDDPLEILAEIERLLDSIDLTDLEPESQAGIKAVLSLNSWIQRGGEISDWGTAGPRALEIVSNIAEILWPKGELEIIIAKPQERLIAVMDLLRFSGFGPKE
jgi:hypothetical protein